jgi:hypothetical protein
MCAYLSLTSCRSREASEQVSANTRPPWTNISSGLARTVEKEKRREEKRREEKKTYTMKIAGIKSIEKRPVSPCVEEYLVLYSGHRSQLHALR